MVTSKKTEKFAFSLFLSLPFSPFTQLRVYGYIKFHDYNLALCIENEQRARQNRYFSNPYVEIRHY